MNREILFRGKHIHVIPNNKHLDGIWVYGYLADKNYINVGYGDKLVDEKTVCQYTGFQDKNGKKIFENDILVAYLDEEYPDVATYEQVIWNKSGFFTMQKDSIEREPLDDFITKNFEVCGNIFDNAEILERKE